MGNRTISSMELKNINNINSKLTKKYESSIGDSSNSASGSYLYSESDSE